MNSKFIFVDDEETVLTALKRDMANTDPEYFTSAEDALSYLDQYQIGIVVSVLKMPDMDGIRFLKEVQRSYPDTYRVILSRSGVAAPNLKAALMNRTIEQYFANPWDVNELLTYFGKFKNYEQYSVI